MLSGTTTPARPPGRRSDIIRSMKRTCGDTRVARPPSEAKRPVPSFLHLEPRKNSDCSLADTLSMFFPNGGLVRTTSKEPRKDCLSNAPPALSNDKELAQ